MRALTFFDVQEIVSEHEATVAGLETLAEISAFVESERAEHGAELTRWRSSLRRWLRSMDGCQDQSERHWRYLRDYALDNTSP